METCFLLLVLTHRVWGGIRDRIVQCLRTSVYLYNFCSFWVRCIGFFYCVVPMESLLSFWGLDDIFQTAVFTAAILRSFRDFIYPQDSFIEMYSIPGDALPFFRRFRSFGDNSVTGIPILNLGDNWYAPRSRWSSGRRWMCPQYFTT